MQNGHVSVGIVKMIVKVGGPYHSYCPNGSGHVWNLVILFSFWRQVLMVAQAAFEFAV